MTTDQATETEKEESEKLHPEKLKASDFAFLKTDPGAVGLDSFLTEMLKPTVKGLLRNLRTIYEDTKMLFATP